MDSSDAKSGTISTCCEAGRQIYDLRQLVFTLPLPTLLLTSRPDHRDRINLIYTKNNISVSKVTHGGRGYAVKVSREHGASVEGAKALGGWSESGSFRPCYDRALPVDAMLGAAMFDALRPEAHFYPVNPFVSIRITSPNPIDVKTVPPVELMTALFPWVEGEQMAL